MDYLSANEISCRVQQISEKGISLLLYITSRDAQKRLDEKYGTLGWQDSYREVGGELFCCISAWDRDKKLWVSKEDVGSLSRVEKEKGRASDAFKRACVKHGIGRELYTAPFIWIPGSQCSIKLNSNGTASTKDKFSVNYINYTATGEIDELEIINQKLEIVFKQYSSGRINNTKYKVLMDMIEELNINQEQWKETLRIDNFRNLDEKRWKQLMDKLEEAKEKKKEGA